MTENKMRILLLGPPVVYQGEAPFPIKRKQLRALLFFLACQNDWISRGELNLVFWPDDPEKEARQSLRELLSKLRSQLPEEGLLKTDQDRVRLDPERVEVDVREFQELVETTAHLNQALIATPLPEPVYQNLLQANRLWRANRFMAGANLINTETFDRWLTTFGQQMEQNRHRVLRRLSDDALLRRDGESAVHWLRLGLETDPFDTELHINMVKTLRELGRFEEARNHIRSMTEFFRAEEMGELPAEILVLQQKINEDIVHPIDHNRVIWPGTHSLQLPFVGQQVALDKASESFAHGGMLVILGEAGSGKTRLVKELFERLKPSPRLLLANCRPAERDLPFQPIVEMLRASVTSNEWEQLEPYHKEQLAWLMPELMNKQASSKTLSRPSPDLSQQLVFEALRQLLIILAPSQRLLLFFDDVHWSDDTSLAAIAYLVERQFFTDHRLLVLASRIEEQPQSHDSLLRKIRIPERAPHLRLEPLALDEISILARMALGRAPSSTLANRLLKDSGGNPLVILELLRVLLENSVGPEEYWGDKEIPLPNTLQALLRDRLFKISPNARTVLSTAAIIGTTFNLSILESACQMEPEQVVEALDELENSHLVSPTPVIETGIEYAFIHEKIRDLLLEEISLAKKRLIHLRIAKVLSERSGKTADRAAVLAHHFQSAGENLPAFNAWLNAAEHARKLFSTTEANHAYQQAERLFPTIAEQLPDEALNRLFTGQAELGYDIGDEKKVMRVCTLLRTHAELRNSHFLMGTALSGLAGAAVLRREPEEVSRLLEEAIPYLDETGEPFNRMWAYNRLGFYKLVSTKLDESIQAYEISLRIGRECKDLRCSEAAMEALSQLALVQSFQGKPAEAQSNVNKVISTTQGQSTRPGIITYAYLSHCHSLYWLGKYEECQSAALIGIQNARMLKNWRVEGYLQISLAYASLALGKLETGYTACQNAIELAKKVNNPDLLSEAHNVLADFHTALVDDIHFPQVLAALAKGAMQKYQVLQGKFRNAAWSCRNGAGPSGLSELEKSIEEADSLSMHLLTWQAKAYHAQILLTEERIEEAEQEIQSVLSESNSNQVRLIRPNPELLLSQIFLVKNDLDKARDWINPILVFARQSKALLLEIEALEMLRSTQQAGRLADNFSRRVLELLGEIENPSEGSALLPGFEMWRSQLLQHLSK